MKNVIATLSFSLFVDEERASLILITAGYYAYGNRRKASWAFLFFFAGRFQA
jgi:hypothetical protein